MALGIAAVGNPASVGVPQADNLDRVFEVVEVVGGGLTASADVADYFRVVDRQGFYYVAAAELLGLVERTETGLHLTHQGRRYYVAIPQEQRRMRAEFVFAVPAIREIARQLGIMRLRLQPTAHQRELLMDTGRVAPLLEEMGLAPETALRRAYTLRAWLRSLTE